MSLLNNSLLLGADAAAGGYQISRSLRFNSSDSAYLSRTPASAGNRQTWSWSGWVKRSNIPADARMALFSAEGGANDTDYFEFGFNSAIAGANSFYWSQWTLAGASAAVFRDPSAWYHVVVSYNGANITCYVNNQQVLQSAKTGNLGINGTWVHNIGRIPVSGGSRYFDGYLADIHFIDGQALDPTSFGEFDTNGIWQPKRYSGIYGSQGWKLDFADNSSNAATALGKDTSGNGNNWTPNNLSVTAGAGNDSLVDSPTNYGTDTGVGGEVRGNYCTWNPLNIASGALSNGNLDLTNTGGGRKVGTIGVSSGKWYWEVAITSAGDAMVGIMPPSNPAQTATANFIGGPANEYGYYGPNGQKYNSGAATTYGATYGSGDIIGVALDSDAGTLVFYKNGVSQGTAFSSISGTFTAGASAGVSSGASMTANFGQRPFAYTAPSGFKALCTANLPAPTITKPNSVFDVKLWTGNGSTQAISGLGFSPDFVWYKSRVSNIYNHGLFDIVRGAQNFLASNSTTAEIGSISGVTAFNSDSFTVGSDLGVNETDGSYVAWTWDAGSSTVTNTQGSITSSVRANASAGFSIVTYTGNGSSGATIGHGLGVAPEFFVVKSRNTTGTGWLVYAKPLGATSFLELESTAAVGSNATAWNDTAPSSTLITLGNSAFSNGNAFTYVAYCFAPVAGYSAALSWTGNGSSDGVFVYCGFRPRMVLIKATSITTDPWVIVDTARNPFNVTTNFLLPNSTNAEGSVTLYDLLSNGIKFRSTAQNDNGVQYVAYAWAEAPFSLARAR